GLEPELAVVVAGVAAEPAGEAPAPGPLLPVGAIRRSGADVGEVPEHRVRRGLGDAPGDEDVLVGEGDRGPAVELPDEGFEGGAGGAALLGRSQAPQDAGRAADPLQGAEQEAVQVGV